MTLGQNLIAGIVNLAWTALTGFLAIPYYIKYLGIGAYGLIGFFITTQTLLSLLDMGLSSTINREVAKYKTMNRLKEAGKLLHTLAIIYWITALAIGLLMIILSPLIQKYWLQSSSLNSETITHALMLMGIVVACRWPVSLYQGVLIGAQQLVLSSSLNMCAVTISNLGAIYLLAYISPTIETFFSWQACINLLYTIGIWLTAWKIIGKTKNLKFDIKKLKGILKFTLGMSGIGIASIIFTQLDKLLLSHMLNLADFGRYVFAGTFASSLYVLIIPLFNVLYPQMTKLVTLAKKAKLIYLYKTGTQLFLSFFFPVVCSGSIFSEDILFIWTRDQNLASSVAPIASILLLGTALNGVMNFPYALQLAYGATRIALKIIIFLIFISVPVIILLSKFFGVIGGACSWLFFNTCYLFVGTWLTHKELLKHEAISWLVGSVFYPIATSSIVLIIGWKLMYIKNHHYFNFFLASCLTIISMVINLISMPGKTIPKLRQLGLLNYL